VLSVEDKWKVKELLRVGAKDLFEQRLSIYYICAKQFGWTPKQVDEIGVRTLLLLLEMEKEVQKELEREIRLRSRV